jgi:hypothetical protein
MLCNFLPSIRLLVADNCHVKGAVFSLRVTQYETHQRFKVIFTEEHQQRETLHLTLYPYSLQVQRVIVASDHTQ